MSEDYLRLIAAQLETLLFLNASFVQFQKPWNNLTAEEKEAVRVSVMRPVAEHFGWLTPDYLYQWAKNATPDPRQSNRQMGFVWPDKKD